MKIINKNHGRTTGYIQGKDILLLHDCGKDLPKEMSVCAVTELDVKKFFSYSDRETILFIESQESLIDYSDIYQSTTENIDSLIYTILSEKERITKLVLNRLTNDTEMLLECQILSNKVTDLFDILSLRRGKNFLNLPNIVDYSLFQFDRCDSNYIIGYSLNPNRLLLSRKDHQLLTIKEKIDDSFIQAGVSLAIIEKRSRKALDFDFKVEKQFSEDCRYLEINFVPNEVIIRKKQMCKVLQSGFFKKKN